MRTPEELLGTLGFRTPVRERRPLAVCCDFDGTVTARDLATQTLEQYGRPEWYDLELQWRRGELPSHECMCRQFATVEVTADQLRRLYDNAEVTGGFEQLVSWCRREDLPLAILSDGLDLYIRPVLRRLGLGDLPFVANHAEFVEGRFHLDFPHRNAACGRCGACKCSFLQALRTCAHRIAYIGDGHSDRCAALSADIVYARGALAQICTERKQDFVPFRDFGDVLLDLRRRLRG